MINHSNKDLFNLYNFKIEIHITSVQNTKMQQ